MSTRDASAGQERAFVSTRWLWTAATTSETNSLLSVSDERGLRCLHKHASKVHQKRIPDHLHSLCQQIMATSGDSNQRPTPTSGSLQPSFNTLQFGTMSDSQLRQTINQLSHAASGAQYQAYAAPTPQRTAGERTPTRSNLSSRFVWIFRRCTTNSLPEKYR
jgi:hypothetical protein